MTSILRTLFAFLERHLRGFFGPVLAVLGAGVIVAFAAGALFLELADEVMEGTTQAFDEGVLRQFESIRSETLDVIALEITALGGFSTLTLAVLIAAAFLWASRRRYSAYLLMVSAAGASLLNALLKQFFDRPRPDVVEAIADVHTASFPSGHAMSSFVAYSAIGYLVGRLAPESRLRRITWVCAGALILAIGTSRMYLGVHYPSDVVAGYIAGLTWLAALIAAGNAIRYFAHRRPEVGAQERDLESSGSGETR